MSAPLYLDVCALSRPFDEQRYLRIRIETEAVNLILSKAKQGDYRLLVSPVHIKEINAIPDMLERIELLSLFEKLGEPIKVKMQEARRRAEEFVKMGFGVADAAHVAFAEQAAAQFISCDDVLIKKCHNHHINVWCGDPVAFCVKEGLIK